MMTTTLLRLNFRDIGGIAAYDGRLIRKALVYRSEGPASFDELHAEELRALGIRLVCDLRSKIERDRDPHRWLKGDVRVLDLDTNTDLRAASNDGWAHLRDNPTRDGALTAMRHNYAAMPAALLPQLAGFIDALIVGETPMLVHCTAGKDRTGVLLAVLLRALGVAQVDIMQDYLRSDVFAKNRAMGTSLADSFDAYFGFVPPDEVIETLMGVHPAFLEAAFAVIDLDWGGIAGYLSVAGIDRARLAELRDAMLMPSA
jgi:protein-tyrosine phosphatase